jgi:hypothetical protein
VGKYEDESWDMSQSGRRVMREGRKRKEAVRKARCTKFQF